MLLVTSSANSSSPPLYSVSFPEGTVTTLESHEHIKEVELDQEVKTQ